MVSGDWGKDSFEGNYQSQVLCVRGADIPTMKECKFDKLPTRYILSRNEDKCRLQPYDIIIELSGGSPTQSTGRSCIIPEHLVDNLNFNVISTNFCKVLRFKNPQMAVYCYLLLTQWYNDNLFFNYEIGTTGLKNLNLDAVIKLDIKIPDEKSLNKLFELFRICYDKIVKNSIKITKLNELKQLYLKKFFG